MTYQKEKICWCLFIVHLVQFVFSGHCNINSSQDNAFEYQSKKVDWKNDSNLLWNWLEKQIDNKGPTLSNQKHVVTYMNCDINSKGMYFSRLMSKRN